MFRIGPFDYMDCLYVCRNMRAEDVREMMASRGPGETSAEGIAFDCETAKDYTLLAYNDDEPIAVFGVFPIHSSAFLAYMFATDRFHKVSLPLTRWGKRHGLKALRALGARRVEALSLADRDAAHKWIEFFGAKKESYVPRLGIRGEDFIRFVYLWSEDDGPVQA